MRMITFSPKRTQISKKGTFSQLRDKSASESGLYLYQIPREPKVEREGVPFKIGKVGFGVLVRHAPHILKKKLFPALACLPQA